MVASGEERIDRERLGGILAVGGGIGDWGRGWARGGGPRRPRLSASRERGEVDGARRELRLAAVDGDDQWVDDELGDERGAGFALEGRLDAVEDDGARRRTGPRGRTRWAPPRRGRGTRRGRARAGRARAGPRRREPRAVENPRRGGSGTARGSGGGGDQTASAGCADPERWTGGGTGGRARATRTLTETVRVNGGGARDRQPRPHSAPRPRGLVLVGHRARRSVEARARRVKARECPPRHTAPRREKVNEPRIISRDFSVGEIYPGRRVSSQYLISQSTRVVKQSRLAPTGQADATPAKASFAPASGSSFAPNQRPSHSHPVDKMAAVINASLSARVAAPKVRRGPRVARRAGALARFSGGNRMPAFRPIARNNATRLENRTLTLAPIPRASRSPPAAPSSARASPASPPSGTCALGTIARSSATPRRRFRMSRGPRSYRPWGPAVDIDSSRTAIDRDDSRPPPRPDADPDLPASLPHPISQRD